MNLMPRLRVSAISFLNTAPLMWDFEHTALGQAYDISYTLPSLCAEQLRAGAVDIGIIPAAAYATIPDLLVIPDVAIAARGPVRSIFLIGKTPAEQVRSVALDTSSQTSVALLRVLFKRHWRNQPSLVPMAPDLEPMLAKCDAALLIGDPALLAYARLRKGEYHVFDLAEEWQKLTGKNFVFAFWAVRAGAGASAGTATDFQRSRDHGLEPASLAQIAREWSGRIGLTEAQIVAYLTEAIHYRLDAECLQGLHLFYTLAAECDVWPEAPELRFLE
ncbi:MAG: menaquinone biosynthesis protein [Acidobacteriales bacterium]|nr:menaquinone biosynthesis protein [Terriglobales bacterium]